MAEGSAYDPLMTMTGMRVTTVVIFVVMLVKVRSFGGATRRDAVPLVAIGVFDAARERRLRRSRRRWACWRRRPCWATSIPVVTAVLAAIFLHERLRAVQYAGVAVALAGVVMISAGG